MPLPPTQPLPAPNAGAGTADAAVPDPPGDATTDPADGAARWRGCGGSDYERQEFLGDSVIEVCLAHDMYRYWCRLGCDLPKPAIPFGGDAWDGGPRGSLIVNCRIGQSGWQMGFQFYILEF